MWRGENEWAPAGVRLRKETAHRFPAASDPAVLSISTASLSLEYSAHSQRDVFLADAKMVLDALAAVYAPVVPVRLGLRYVNAIQCERVAEGLGRSVPWAELLNPAFAVPPGGVATFDQSTNFVVELSSPCDRGTMTLRYGALVDAPGTTQHFRLDTDRYVEGGFALADVESLLKRFSEDIFQVFMTAAGPALVEWMTKPRPDDMMTTTVALMLSVGTGPGPAPVRSDARLIRVSTGTSETPLPEHLAPTGLRETPTEALVPTRAIVSELAAVERALTTASVLEIDAAAQARVDEILAANTPKASPVTPLR